MNNQFEAFSIEELEYVFSDEADKDVEKLNELVKLMKDAVQGALWHKFKVLRNDYDKFIFWSQKANSKLHNGAITGLTTAEGKPVYSWKPNQEQHDELVTLVTALKLTDADIKKYSLLHRNRMEQRTLSSGTAQQRREFEGEREQRPYAKFDNEAAIAEMEQKRAQRLKAV
jgi:hypothetical protein